MDVKKEQLAPNEFLCKICWKKSKDLKFHITVQDCDMGSWNNTGEGFSICDECFSGMTSFIDAKSSEIIESMINSIKVYENAHKSGHILHSIIERRIGEMSKLRDKLKEVIRDRGNQEKGGGSDD